MTEDRLEYLLQQEAAARRAAARDPQPDFWLELADYSHFLAANLTEHMVSIERLRRPQR